MKRDELELVQSDAERARLVVVRDEQTEAGVRVVRVGEEERAAADDAQTRQRHQLGVVGHDQHVPSHLLDVLPTQHTHQFIATRGMIIHKKNISRWAKAQEAMLLY